MREKLRTAIERHRRAVEAVDQATDRRRAVHEAHLEALRELRRVREELAKAGGGARLDYLLAGAEAPSLDELRRAVELAEKLVAARKADEDLLDGAINDRMVRVRLAEVDRAMAVGEVMHPTAERLLTEFHEHHSAAASIKAQLEAFPPGSLPPTWSATRNYAADVVTRWRDVAAGLSTDPDFKFEE